MQRNMILVCHAADGHFANGDREAIRRVLDQSDCIAALTSLGTDRYEVVCADGGRLELYAPGLSGNRSFHRMELFLDAESWTRHMLCLILDLMRKGRFGLMDGLETTHFIVASEQQIAYFPRLPQAPLLVRNPRDLGQNIL